MFQKQLLFFRLPQILNKLLYEWRKNERFNFLQYFCEFSCVFWRFLCDDNVSVRMQEDDEL